MEGSRRLGPRMGGIRRPEQDAQPKPKADDIEMPGGLELPETSIEVLTKQVAELEAELDEVNGNWVRESTIGNPIGMRRIQRAYEQRVEAIQSKIKSIRSRIDALQNPKPTPTPAADLVTFDRPASTPSADARRGVRPDFQFERDTSWEEPQVVDQSELRADATDYSSATASRVEGVDAVYDSLSEDLPTDRIPGVESITERVERETEEVAIGEGRPQRVPRPKPLDLGRMRSDEELSTEKVAPASIDMSELPTVTVDAGDIMPDAAPVPANRPGPIGAGSVLEVSSEAATELETEVARNRAVAEAPTEVMTRHQKREVRRMAAQRSGGRVADAIPAANTGTEFARRIQEQNNEIVSDGRSLADRLRARLGEDAPTERMKSAERRTEAIDTAREQEISYEGVHNIRALLQALREVSTDPELSSVLGGPNNMNVDIRLPFGTNARTADGVIVVSNVAGVPDRFVDIATVAEALSKKGQMSLTQGLEGIPQSSLTREDLMAEGATERIDEAATERIDRSAA